MMDDYPEFYPDPQSDARAQSVSPAGYSSGVQLSEMTALLDQIHVLREKLDAANAIIAAMTAKAVPSREPHSMPARALFCRTQKIGIR
jgi:threonine synthase